MIELTDTKVYRLLATKYSDCLLDYIILLCDDCNYEGESTHKKAVINAFNILNRRERIGNNYHFFAQLDPDKMLCTKCNMNEFMDVSLYQDLSAKAIGTRYYQMPDPLPYSFAFLEPPYEVPYGVDDFIKLNNLLFPFPDSCELYRWSDDFSNYFNDGKEWWGTGCWSIYDQITTIFTIILASLSD